MKEITNCGVIKQKLNIEPEEGSEGELTGVHKVSDNDETLKISLRKSC